MKRRPSALLLALLIGLAGLTAGAGVHMSLALFTNTATDQSTISSRQVYSGTRSTAAFSVRDASDGAAATDQSSTNAFDDNRLRSTNAWSSAFGGTRYLELDMSAPLPAGLTISSVTFDFKFASLGAGTACFYFETRTASTGALLATYGSSGSPTGCVTGSTQTNFSANVASSVTNSDIANDLRLRVYGRESNSVGWNVELATVSGSTSASAFTLYRTTLVDQATGAPTTDIWGPEAAGDGYSYTTANSWGTTYGASRYVEFRFPSFAPAGSAISAAEFRHSYRPQSGGLATPAYVNSTTSSNGAKVGSFAIAVPAGTQNGDLIVTAISAAAAITFTAPACNCWSTANSQQAAALTVALYYRVASSEPASYTWTFSKNEKYSAFSATYRGVSGTPLDIANSQTNTTSTSITAPTITTTAPGDLLLYVGGTNNGVSFTPDASMTERADVAPGMGNNDSAITLNEQILGAAGATGTRAATSSGNPGASVGINAAFKAAAVSPNSCYYFEVYQSNTLLATHGSSGSPISCNSSTSTNAADVVSLPEVDTVAKANNLRIRLYFKDAASAKTLHDRVRVALTYSTP